MRTTVPLLALPLALCAAGCGGGPRRNPDAAFTFDAFAAIDAPFFVDAHVSSSDAGTSPDAAAMLDAPTTTDAPLGMTDAFVAADAPAAADAAVSLDASSADAFTARDAFAGTDSRVPVDAGPVTCTALPATGASTSSGDTATTGLTWERPLAGTCPATSYSSVGTAVGYQLFTFCNEGADGTFDFEVGSAFDSYLVVYDGGAIPADPLACLEGDDDSAGSSNALVSGLSVLAGGVVTVVVSGFDNTDVGAFTLTTTRN